MIVTEASSLTFAVAFLAITGRSAVAIFGTTVVDNGSNINGQHNDFGVVKM